MSWPIPQYPGWQPLQPAPEAAGDCLDFLAHLEGRVDILGRHAGPLPLCVGKAVSRIRGKDGPVPLWKAPERKGQLLRRLTLGFPGMQWRLPPRLSNDRGLLRKDLQTWVWGQEHKAEKVGMGIQLCQ